jgi:hypothetical protein
VWLAYVIVLGAMFVRRAVFLLNACIGLGAFFVAFFVCWTIARALVDGRELVSHFVWKTYAATARLAKHAGIKTKEKILIPPFMFHFGMLLLCTNQQKMDSKYEQRKFVRQFLIEPHIQKYAHKVMDWVVKRKQLHAYGYGAGLGIVVGLGCYSAALPFFTIVWAAGMTSYFAAQQAESYYGVHLPRQYGGTEGWTTRCERAKQLVASKGFGVSEQDIKELRWSPYLAQMTPNSLVCAEALALAKERVLYHSQIWQLIHEKQFHMTEEEFRADVNTY